MNEQFPIPRGLLILPANVLRHVLTMPGGMEERRVFFQQLLWIVSEGQYRRGMVQALHYDIATDEWLLAVWHWGFPLWDSATVPECPRYPLTVTPEELAWAQTIQHLEV